MNIGVTIVIAAASLAGAVVQPAQAQATFPSKPIVVIVPFPAGGAPDTIMRLLGPKLSEVLKQPIVIDNKGGGSGSIGLSIAALAPADGHTLVIGTASSLGANPLVSKVSFDPIKDFTPVAMLASEPLALAVHPSVPANTVQELIELAKKTPGGLNMASFGTGSVSHLAGELFSSMAGIKLVHVPYRGAAPATADLMAGQVSLMFNSISVFVPPVRSGRLKMLATGGATRTPGMPDLPTVAESGVPGFEASSWHAVMGPANLPPQIVAQLSKVFAAALQLPEVRERFASLSLEPQSGTPEQVAAQLQRDIAKWRKVAQDLGIKVN